jgi:hypothetical protein
VVNDVYGEDLYRIGVEQYKAIGEVEGDAC